MGFAKILGCISLENIFAYISAFLYLYPLFFLAAFRLNAKDISSRFKSLSTTSSWSFKVVAAAIFSNTQTS